jgi:Rieske Fe-S protein
VSWFPQSGLFMCPCHGGVYYSNGERASGPPPRGLFHCAWRVKMAGSKSRRHTTQPFRTR